MSKTMSNSVADLSLSMHNQKISSTNIRLSTFQSKLDQCCLEAYKKIPLSQSFDWGILAITNTDLILLYNKDKSSLIVYDANGHENEVIRREIHRIDLIEKIFFYHYSREFNGQMVISKIYVCIMRIV